MPVTYDLDASSGVIYTHANGAVTVPELMTHFDVLAADERLPERIHLLLDLRKTESLPDPEEVDVIMHKVERLKAERGLKGGSCAIVSDRDSLRSHAQLLATYVAGHFEHVHVCRGFGEAEDWLAAHR